MDILKKYNEGKSGTDTGGESQVYHAQYPSNSETSKLTQWVMKYFGGLIKDETQANQVLVGFSALAIIISLVVILSGGNFTLEKPGLETLKNAPSKTFPARPVPS